MSTTSKLPKDAPLTDWKHERYEYCPGTEDERRPVRCDNCNRGINHVFVLSHANWRGEIQAGECCAENLAYRYVEEMSRAMRDRTNLCERRRNWIEKPWMTSADKPGNSWLKRNNFRITVQPKGAEYGYVVYWKDVFVCAKDGFTTETEAQSVAFDGYENARAVPKEELERRQEAERLRKIEVERQRSIERETKLNTPEERRRRFLLSSWGTTQKGAPKHTTEEGWVVMIKEFDNGTFAPTLCRNDHWENPSPLCDTKEDAKAAAFELLERIRRGPTEEEAREAAKIDALFRGLFALRETGS